MVSSMPNPQTLRHPELVSGSISQHRPALAARWMLKRVQHDGLVNGAANSNLLRASAPQREQNLFRAEAAEFRRDAEILS